MSNFFVGGLLGLSLAILIVAGRVEAAGPSAPEIVSQKIDIDYGENINVEAVVDVGPSTGDPVSSARALFRPRGGSTIWSYSYPEFAVADDQVTITFEINTGPGAYYPPGAEFDIEFEIIHESGDSSTVRSQKSVEYLDPNRDWQRLEGDGYTVVYYGVSRSEVVDLVETIDFRIPTLQATLGVTDTPDFKAIVFPSIQDATPSFPPVSQTATDQFLFAGFAQPEYRLFVQGQMNSTTFTHELAHLYTHEAVSSSLQGGLPAWLNEGLARFLESGSSERSNERLRSSVRPDELLSLRNMQTIPGQRSDVFIFYPQAGAFVGYLVEEYGHASMAGFLAAINTGSTLLDGFEQTYGITLYESENDWRARFDAAPLALPSATSEPGDSEQNVKSTPVPLVDYSKAGGAGSEEDSSQPDDVSPVFLPTATALTGGRDSETANGDLADPNYAVAAFIIGLSIVTGVWLFTSRRKASSRNS